MQAQQNTQSAVAQQQRADFIEPAIAGAADLGWRQFSQKLMDILGEGMPSADAIKRSKEQRAELLQNAIGSLRPEEPSWLDAAVMGIGSYGKPVEQGQVGAALGAMGAGAVRARQEMQTREQQKAATAFGLADKEFDQQQKLMADGLSKGQKFQQQATGKWVPSPKEPGVFVNNVTGERRVMSDADALAIRDLTGKMMTAKYHDSPQDAMDAAIQTHFGIMPKGAAAPSPAPAGIGTPRSSTGTPTPPPVAIQNPAATGQMPPPVAPPAVAEPVRPPASTPVNALAPAVSPPPVNGMLPSVTPKINRPELVEGEVGTLEGFEFLRKALNEASRSGDRQKFDALMKEMQKIYPNGKDSIGAGTPPLTQQLTGNPSNWPMTSSQKAESKSSAEFTVTPQEAVLQGVPYMPSVYEKYTDPKRREEAMAGYQKQWQDWQEKKIRYERNYYME
jgi:hypothetical protein